MLPVFFALAVGVREKKVGNLYQFLIREAIQQIVVNDGLAVDEDFGGDPVQSYLLLGQALVVGDLLLLADGYPKAHPGGSFKAKEDTELENTFTVNYYKLEIDGEEIVEIDVMNNIYKVGGEDLLAERRQNLGL